MKNEEEMKMTDQKEQLQVILPESELKSILSILDDAMNPDIKWNEDQLEMAKLTIRNIRGRILVIKGKLNSYIAS